MEITKRNGNKQSEYEQFKNKLKNTISEYETELIELIKSVATTYGDVDKELRAIKQYANWDNDEILLSVIENIERHFEKKKGSLLL